jgi:phage terminase large subunit-like protein
VWDVLDSAMGAREQPMTVAITTAGVFDKEGIGWEQHDYACKVLDGTFDDDSFYAFIAAPDEGDDLFSDVALQKANPNWGVSAKTDFLQKQAQKAQRTPGFYNEYVTKHLNMWSQQAKRWLPMEKWTACEVPVPALELRAAAVAREKALEKKKCRAGLDLSSKLDLTAFVLEFQKEGDEVELICRFWIPEAQVKAQAEKGKRHYETWARAGWLKVTDGDVIDYEFIRKEVNDLSQRYVVKEIAFDPWNGLDLATRLTADGRTMVECHQGYKTLSEPSKDVEAKVVQGKVKHMNHPVLRWCASNVSVATDPAGNIKPDKAKATDKIDGIVAWIMARSRGIVNKEENRDSTVLAEGGILLG